MRLHAAVKTFRTLLSAMFWLTIPACGDSAAGVGEDDGGGALGRCGLRADVTGGVAIQFTGKNDAGCATQHSFDTGLDVSFLGTNGKGTFELAVEDVAEGETASDYPARIAVASRENERWQSSGCLASISEHRLVTAEDSELGELRHYQVSGEGTCTEPLEPARAGSDAAMLDSFAFRAEFTWRD